MTKIAIKLSRFVFLLLLFFYTLADLSIFMFNFIFESIHPLDKDLVFLSFLLSRSRIKSNFKFKDNERNKNSNENKTTPTTVVVSSFRAWWGVNGFFFPFFLVLSLRKNHHFLYSRIWSSNLTIR